MFNNLQWSLTGGKFSSLAMSALVSSKHSSVLLPLTHSVATELCNMRIAVHSERKVEVRKHKSSRYELMHKLNLEAMAEPHPNVLNFASTTLSFSNLS